ncbi:hypothetical protein DIPPA_34896, partial [Diplonema papillatum]
TQRKRPRAESTDSNSSSSSASVAKARRGRKKVAETLRVEALSRDLALTGPSVLPVTKPPSKSPEQRFIDRIKKTDPGLAGFYGKRQL